MKNKLIIKYEIRKFKSWLNSLETWKLEDNKIQTNKLFYLVKKGKKTATSYLYDDNIPLSQKGDFSILENHKSKKRLLVQTVKVEVKEFNKVDQHHAKKEGEGNLSLRDWKEIHKEFFRKELKEKNLQFNEDLKIVLEEFKVIKKL